MDKKEKEEKVSFLIRCLLEEMPEYRQYTIPADPGEAFNLYRALCNVRLPQKNNWHSLPKDFYQIQAEVLQDITREKGITVAADLPPCKKDARLSLWQGDITTLQADAIVNAANSQLLGCFRPLHGCIDNIIHTMAGVELRENCCQLMQEQGKEEAVGQAQITPGYNLPARYVLHTVGPFVQGFLTNKEKQQLASCYTSCLALADAYQLRNLAFCCISTGVFRFPPEKAAAIAVETVTNWLDQHNHTRIKKVIFNVFTDRDKKIYQSKLERGV